MASRKIIELLKGVFVANEVQSTRFASSPLQNGVHVTGLSLGVRSTVYSPAGSDSGSKRFKASDELNVRLLTRVPVGPSSDQRRLPLFVRESK